MWKTLAIDNYLKTLDQETEVKYTIEVEKIFTFGCGTQRKSKGKYNIPAFIADRYVKIKNDVVDSEISLLISRNEGKN